MSAWHPTCPRSTSAFILTTVYERTPFCCRSYSFDFWPTPRACSSVRHPTSAILCATPCASAVSLDEYRNGPHHRLQPHCTDIEFAHVSCRSQEQLIATLQSPQFRRVLDVFNAALVSGRLDLRHFGLDPKVSIVFVF